MESEKGTWPLYDEVIEPAARRVAPLVRQYGWDADDCAQAAALWLVDENPLSLKVLALPEAERTRYLKVAVRRHIVRKARPAHRAVIGEVLSAFERLEARGASAAALWLEYDDLVESAVGDVREWLRARAVAGLTICEAQKALGWTAYHTDKVRGEAAAWLLDQFEGVSAGEVDRG